MPCGFDDDLAKQATATSNRIRGLLTLVHPALERVPGPAQATGLTSMPAVGVRTGAPIITEAIGKEFKSAGHAASHAGPATVTWRSGTSIRGDHPSNKGNKALKRAFFLSAFAALKDSPSRAYHDRKRAEGKRRNRAPRQPNRQEPKTFRKNPQTP